MRARTAQAVDDAGAIAERDEVSGLLGRQLGGAAVVDDDGDEADGHRLQHDAAAEFPDAGEGQQVGIGQQAGDLLVLDPAGQPHAGLDPLPRTISRSSGIWGPSPRMSSTSALADQRGGGLQQHVGPLVRDEPAEEDPAHRGRGRPGAHRLLAVHVGGVLGDVELLEVVLLGDLRPGAQRSDRDRRRLAPGGALARQQLVARADVGEPLLLLPADGAEVLRPGEAAVDRPHDEGDAGASAMAGDRAGVGHAQRGDPMDEVEFAALDPRRTCARRGARSRGTSGWRRPGGWSSPCPRRPGAACPSCRAVARGPRSRSR